MATHHSRQASGTSVLAEDEIELRMRAVRGHVPGVRALAAERAMRAGHDLDFVDDLRLAVDEVCAIMLDNCTPADLVTVRLAVGHGGAWIRAWVPCAGPETVNGLSLNVLRALADSLDYWVDDTGGQRTMLLAYGRTAPSRRP